MKKSFNAITGFCIILCMLCFACQCKLTGPNEIDCNNNTLHLSANAKSYFYFKEGSWWLYYNEAIGKYDSLFVAKTELSARQPLKELGDDLNKCYEYARISIGDSINKEIFYNYIDINSSERTSYLEVQYKNNNSNMELYFQVDSLETINSVLPYEIRIIDSLKIQNKWYRNLIEVKSDKIPFDNFNYRLYAKNIGLIKFIDKQSNKWELIKYNINQ